MCSIFGAYALSSSGSKIDMGIVDRIRELAQDRGRDGGRVQSYEGGRIVLGNWRATPTPEIDKDFEYQPYDGIIHNGTIANDAELGGIAGEIDSQCLPRVVIRDATLEDFARSLEQIKGSYAIAAVAKSPSRGPTVFLGANYKPLYYAVHDGVLYFSSMERHLRPVFPWHIGIQKLPAYTCFDPSVTALASENKRFVKLKRRVTNKCLVIASAGLDSTVAATMKVREGKDVTLLHFQYGCKAEGPETKAIQRIAEDLGCKLIFRPLDYSGAQNSTLFTGEIGGAIEGAEYAIDWVPARNLLMMANACAYAEANGYDEIVLGANLEEGGAYPDNEEEFIHLLNQAFDYAVNEGHKVHISIPLGNLMKYEIVAKGVEFKAPLAETWSCYRGGEHHCGECGPCFMRKTAFERNGLTDPVFEATT